MHKDTLPEWERLLSAAAHLQRIIPDAVLVGGAVENLKNEGIKEKVDHVGDVMYDAALAFGKIAGNKSHILETLSVRKKAYSLMTLHRAENTDFPERLKEIRDLSAGRFTGLC